MALTLSIKKKYAAGGRWNVIADVTFDNSYATTGEAVDLAALGLQTVDIVHAAAARNAAGALGFLPSYNHVTGKLQALTGAAPGAPLGEIANTTDLSAFTTRLHLIGTRR